MAGGSEAKYLLSKSTNACLTVVSGSKPHDAVLDLEEYSGDLKQLWYIHDGCWEWGYDRTLCLAPDLQKRNLCLIPKSSKLVRWSLDSEERLTFDSHTVLDVSQDKTRKGLILFPKHNGLNQKWSLMTDTAGIFLISQSSHTVVSVVSGSGPNDAKVGMALYEGCVQQQWFYKDRQLRWAKNQNLCLVIDKGSKNLTLSNCSCNPAAWTMDDDGIIMCGNLVLDVPWEKPRQRLIAYPKHGGINQRWRKISSLASNDHK